MSEPSERLEKLIDKSKSNDVDARVDAITKLQAEFESGVEISEPDTLIAALKACLRTSNQHLTTATLFAIQHFVPLLTHANTAAPPSPSGRSSSSSSHSSSIADPHALHNLRQALLAFLPTGGVIDRLGDGREKARDAAREALVSMGTTAFKSGGTNPTPAGSFKGKDPSKGAETPLAIFERFVRELGFASKVWRVREQIILTLVSIRQSNPFFPIKPYLTPLVETLEDGDGTVRECSRQSVITLFSGPTVTDAARADLKNEMNKRGVRKSIVDGVLLKLLSSSSTTGAEESAAEDRPPPTSRKTMPSTAPKPGVTSRSVTQPSVRDAPPERPPSSMAGEASSSAGASITDVSAVYIASARDLEQEFSRMLPHFEGKETEHNWAARERSVVKIRGMIKGEAHIRFTDAFLAGLKANMLDRTLKTLASLRTTVASQACFLYVDLAVSLGPSLDPFVETLLTNLLHMAGFTKKIAAQQSQAAVTSILTNTSCQPRITLTLLHTGLQEKTVQARQFVIGHVKTFLEQYASRNKHTIESSGGVDILDKCLRRGLADPNPAVRDTTRQCFWLFEAVWRVQARPILESLDSTAKKQLEKAHPNPEALHNSELAPELSTPVKKKSSVAAAIAASRAKAKQIATAPPTLRHAATSAAHAAAAGPRSPVTHSATTGTMSRTGQGGLVSPPRSRSGSPPIVNTNISPTSRKRLSASNVPYTRSPVSMTSPFRGASTPSPPPSPTADMSHRRQSSSAAVSSRTATLPANNVNRLSVSSAKRHSTVGIMPTTPEKPPSRQSPSPPNKSFLPSEDSSLLLATQIPVPTDSDEEENSFDMRALSSPSRGQRPPTFDFAPASPTLPSASSDGGMVEDALFAQAAQAESAAERLNELMEPEAESPHTAPRAAPFPVVIPQTPVNRTKKSGLKQLAVFQDSPAVKATPSIMDHLYENKHETGWWLKRKTLLEEGTPLKPDLSTQSQTLKDCITALDKQTATIATLQKVVLLCNAHPVSDEAESPIQASPSTRQSRRELSASQNGSSFFVEKTNIWGGGRVFDTLFRALAKFAQPEKDPDLLEHSLLVVMEMVEHQTSYLNERDVLSLLFRVRYANTAAILEATSTIRDALIARLEPVYGLQTVHASLKDFLVEPIPNTLLAANVQLGSHAFGIIGLGKFIMRLPAEILEDELPRLKGSLTSVLDDKNRASTTVREAAYASIVAAQAILRDERHLFALLDGLEHSKKNLLTYYFDKHGARGVVEGVGSSESIRDAGGEDRVVKELNRLDVKLSTPVK